jgi:hypothetical protein
VIRAQLARCSFCSLLLLAASAHATWLTAAELDRHCDAFLSDAQSRGGAICAAFIQGFIAGGEPTDGNVSVNAWPPGSFTERAVRTRAGSRVRAPADRAYCIDSGLPAAIVIERVTAHMHARSGDAAAARRDDAPAAWSVYEALVASFPCEDP